MEKFTSLTMIGTFFVVLTIVLSNGEHGMVMSTVENPTGIGSWESAVASSIMAVQMGRKEVMESMAVNMGYTDHANTSITTGGEMVAMVDCVELYDDSLYRLRNLVGGSADIRIAVSAALTAHRTCLDGMEGVKVAEAEKKEIEVMANVTQILRSALDLSTVVSVEEMKANNGSWRSSIGNEMLNSLVTWNPYRQRPDIVVAQDGSGDHLTIGDAVASLHRRRFKGSTDRVKIIYVKAGVYKENVEIHRGIRNVMMVGDGIGRTVITDRRSVHDGYTTYRSATFGVSGDGFLARDMTFENTAGPSKHQAVAIRVSSDRSVFYRCSFLGYQDTLFSVSGRQFYRECDIYGTVDFIFGNAATVIQSSTIHVRRPMSHQENMITAQGRDDPNDSTGISIHDSRIVPSPEMAPVKRSYKTYLGRPWKKYSRVVYMRTDMDGMVHPKGWSEWNGKFGLDTLYYGEYRNSGEGGRSSGRVGWKGYHLMADVAEAEPFCVGRFLQGLEWLPRTGVPFSFGL